MEVRHVGPPDRKRRLHGHVRRDELHLGRALISAARLVVADGFRDDRLLEHDFCRRGDGGEVRGDGVDGLGVGERRVARDLEETAPIAPGKRHVVKTRKVADRLDARRLVKKIADVLFVAAVARRVDHRVDVAVESVAVTVVAVDRRARHVDGGRHGAQLHPRARLGSGGIHGADAVFRRAEIVGRHRPAADPIVVLIECVEGALGCDIGPVRLARALHLHFVRIGEIRAGNIAECALLVPHADVHLAVDVGDGGHDRVRRRGTRRQNHPAGDGDRHQAHVQTFLHLSTPPSNSSTCGYHTIFPLFSA